jgi:hypothetical protein
MGDLSLTVIPAKAGIQTESVPFSWIPAFCADDGE